MAKNVGKFTPLFIAIAAAMAVSSVSAESASGAAAQGVAQSAPAQSGTDGQADQQTTAAPKDKAVDQANATQLGTVLVTATKRSESLEKVPMAISAVTDQDIDRQHLQNFADYAASAPGLVAMGPPGQTVLSVRGIASGSEQSVATVGTYIDETPFGSSSAYAGGAMLTPNIDPHDLQRVEVLRGPQGTLYGAGALGGVIRFITTPPDATSAFGRVEVGASDVSGGGTGFDVHGMLNVPLIADKLAFRASASTTTTPGFIDDAAQGTKNINETQSHDGNFSLLWTPTDKTSLQLSALVQNFSFANPNDITVDPVTLKPLYGDLQTRTANFGGDAFVEKYRQYNATFKTDFGWAKLTSNTAYTTLDAKINTDVTSIAAAQGWYGLLGMDLGAGTPGTPPSGTFGILEFQPTTQTKFTQEFRLASSEDQAVSWLGGLFFTHEIGNVDQIIPSTDYYTGQLINSGLGPNPIEGTHQPSSYIGYAAYGSATWHINDQWAIEGGLRWAHDKQTYQEWLYGTPVLGLTAAPNLQVDGHSADSSTTYSFSPQFHINDHNMLYARVASGFLPGGPNVKVVNTPNVPATYSPTDLTNYEVGLKSTLLDNTLQLDLAAYHIDWTKITLTTYANGYTFLVGGGQAKSNGFEASAAYIPVRGLKLSLNAAYNKSELTKDAPFPNNGMKGDPLPYAPEFAGAVNGDYDFALGGGWHGYVGGSYQYVGARSTDFAFSFPIAGVPGFAPLPASPRIPGYGTVSLRTGVSKGAVNIDLYVKNLTNKRGILTGSSWQNYVPVAGTLNPVTGNVEASDAIITPRTIGVSVSTTF
ncbi:TonB-dependent receptor [Dyella amyloliquefaciens]|uniref:TonB-dependent receptor n=1 Tax=Dyella amyloliquefaciens TaxID=1770545 RepID=UPI00102E779D|nr:TonB-dependent receptor [Dyella amyloliquefaciens]